MVGRGSAEVGLEDSAPELAEGVDTTEEEAVTLVTDALSPVLLRRWYRSGLGAVETTGGS